MMPGRVLLVGPVGVLGGAERVLLDAVRALRLERPSLALKVIAMTPGPLLQEARAAGAEAELIEMPAALAELGDSAGGRGLELARQLARLAPVPAVLAFQRDLRRSFASFAPDIIHSNGLKAHVLSSMFAPRRVPITWHLHDFVSQRPIMRRGLAAVSHRVSLVLAISRAVADDVTEALGPLPVHVLHNAVDCERFSPGLGDGPWLDGLAGMAPAQAGTLRVGLVATYARWKGHEVFLRAAARVLAVAPRLSVRFYVVGGPIYRTPDSQYARAELVELARMLGLEQRVGFVDFLPDTMPVYRALDVAVHASTSPEPFGLTIVEAMASGRPVIVSYAGGARELVRPGETALAIQPGDVRGLSEQVLRIASDAELRHVLGDAARAEALTRFSRTAWGPRLLAAYARALSAPASSAAP